jgi:hypothetical protein
MTYRQLLWKQLSAITAIASELVPCPAESNRSSQLWKACVAYSNERLLGDELDEACADEKRRQQEEDERLNGRLRVIGFKHWFERWTA